MHSKRPSAELPAPYLEAGPTGTVAPHERAPGEPGYPQARALERLRYRHVTRVRKLSRR